VEQGRDANRPCRLRGRVQYILHYRYDEQRQKRFETVELLGEENEWKPSEEQGAADHVVQLRAPWSEVEVRQQVKEAGGWWAPASRLWVVRYDRAVAWGLKERRVREGS